MVDSSVYLIYYDPHPDHPKRTHPLSSARPRLPTSFWRENCGSRRQSSFSKNVVVEKTSYQMLEILPFSDRERALPLSTEINVLFQPLSVDSLMYDQPATKMS